MLILRENECEHEQGWAERGERESQEARCFITEPDVGARSHEP